MLIPIKCFSCGKPIAHLWEEYQNRLQGAIDETDFKNMEYNLRDDKKGIVLTAGDFKDFEGNTPESQVLDDLGVKRYCCRRMFLGTVDVTDRI